MLSQCPKCGLSKSSGAMGSVLPQCQCDWRMPTLQRTWVELTDEEMVSLRERVQEYTPLDSVKYGEAIQRATVQALKEKNT